MLMAMSTLAADPEERLLSDVRFLGSLVGDTVREQQGEGAFQLVEELRRAGIALRAGRLDGGREALAARIGALDLDDLSLASRAFTQFFHPRLDCFSV